MLTHVYESLQHHHSNTSHTHVVTPRLISSLHKKEPGYKANTPMWEPCSQASPVFFFVLWFAFSIIHGSGRVANKKWGKPRYKANTPMWVYTCKPAALEDTLNSASKSPLCVLILARVIVFTPSPTHWMYTNLTVAISSTTSVCTCEGEGSDMWEVCVHVQHLLKKTHYTGHSH